MIKCTGLNCPMQVGKVDPATCKAADTCEWATKPLTNADRVRAMSDEELAKVIADACDCDLVSGFSCHGRECCDCILDWLKQEVEE